MVHCKKLIKLTLKLSMVSFMVLVSGSFRVTQQFLLFSYSKKIFKRLSVTNSAFPQLLNKISGGGRADGMIEPVMVEPVMVDPEHLRLPMEILASSKSYTSGP